MLRCLPLILIVFTSFSALAQAELPDLSSVSHQPETLPNLLPETGDSKDTVAPFVPDQSGAKQEEPEVLQNQKAEAEKQPQSGDPFMDALASAYQHHPALKAERESLQALDESVSQVVSEFRPQVEAGYSRGRQKREVGDGGDSFQDTRSKTLIAEQPVFSGGESWAKFKSARDRVRAGRARLHALEQQVLYDAVIAYSAMVERQDVLKLNQSNVDVLKRQLDAAKARFDAGELTQTDVAQSQARLAQAQAEERQALGNLEVARAAYRRTISTEPPAILPLPDLPKIIPDTIEQTLSMAQSANPTLVAARYEEKAAGTDIDARVGSLLPEVSLRGSISRLENGSNVQTGKVDTDALTLNVSIPLYQSGAEWSRLREARNRAQEAKYSALDTQHSIIENATSAWQDFNTAQAVIRSTVDALKAAELALEGVQQENQFGTRTVLDVLDAQQEAFRVRVNLVIAQRAEKVQAYRLLAAVGKLTARDLKLPAVIYDPKEHYDSVKYQLLGL